MSKFPIDSEVKFEVSLEIGYDSGFASLRHGAVLSQIRGGCISLWGEVIGEHTGSKFVHPQGSKVRSFLNCLKSPRRRDLGQSEQCEPEYSRKKY